MLLLYYTVTYGRYITIIDINNISVPFYHLFIVIKITIYRTFYYTWPIPLVSYILYTEDSYVTTAINSELTPIKHESKIRNVLCSYYSIVSGVTITH